MENYSAVKKNEMPFAATWMKPEIITLSWVSQRKTNTFAYMQNIKKKRKKRYRWMYLQNRKRLSDFKNKLMVTKMEKLGGGVERINVSDWHIPTTIFKTDYQQGPRELYSTFCNKLNGKITWKRIDTCTTNYFAVWRRKWQPILAFLPGESHRQRSLGGYSPQGRKESDTTGRLHYYYTTTPGTNTIL